MKKKARGYNAKPVLSRIKNGEREERKKERRREASITTSRQRNTSSSPGQSGVRKPERESGKKNQNFGPGERGRNADLSDNANDEHPPNLWTKKKRLFKRKKGKKENSL